MDDKSSPYRSDTASRESRLLNEMPLYLHRRFLTPTPAAGKNDYLSHHGNNAIIVHRLVLALTKRRNPLPVTALNEALIPAGYSSTRSHERSETVTLQDRSKKLV
jgi:hypothetical protein